MFAAECRVALTPPTQSLSFCYCPATVNIVFKQVHVATRLASLRYCVALPTIAHHLWPTSAT